MPSQPIPPSTDAQRLAHVFVRLPTPHPHTSKPSAPPDPAATSGDNAPATAQHAPPSASNDPITPHKIATTFNPLHPHHLPPTPDLTPTSLKRTHTAALPDPPTPSLKRPRTNPAPHRRILRPSSSTAPKFSIVHRPERAKEAVSWRELKRVAESVMGQVDWGCVARDVASNRAAGWYKRAVRDVLQERIEELVRREGMGG